MPVVMQKNKIFRRLFALDANDEFKYPKYFSVLPTGPNTKTSFTEGFFQWRWRRIRSRRRSRSRPRMRSSPATPAKARARMPRSTI